MELYELQQMQSLPLHLKEKKTEQRIIEWYDSHNGMIYNAYSGGLDSSVLVHISHRLYPDIPVVFCNTGQEHPAMIKFVKSRKDLTIIRPEHSYKWVTDNYGFPVVSKAVSHSISRYRTAKDDIQRELRLHGGINPTSGKVQKMGVIPKKYHYLINAPFQISDKCCDVLKKNPFKKYNKLSGRVPMTGELADESNKRKMTYLEHGCNFYGKTEHKSTPLGFWTRQDILKYILKYNVSYCKKLYKDIVIDEKGILKTTGARQTGCWCCMLGLNLEDPDNNRYIQMKVDDPDLYDIYINKYKHGDILNFMGIKY